MTTRFSNGSARDHQRAISYHYHTGERWLDKTQYFNTKWGQSVYTRSDFSTMPLFGEDYVNPAKSLNLTEVGVLPTDALRRRLRYIRKPGFGEPGNPDERRAIEVELKRRK